MAYEAKILGIVKNSSIKGQLGFEEKKRRRETKGKARGNGV